MQSKIDMKVKRQLLWKEMKKNKHNYVLMAPYVILFLTFTIIPVFMSLGISFTYFNLLESKIYWTRQLYKITIRR